MTTRRVFIQLFPAAGGLLAAGLARAQAVVDEKDPLAASLGYVSDAAKANKARFANHAAGQQCGNCAMYQGAAAAASGSCPIFSGKLVMAKGWCSAYSKKA